MFVKYTSGHKPKARPKYESRLVCMLCLWSALQDTSLRQRPKNNSRFSGEYPVLVKGPLWSTGRMYTCKYVLTPFWLSVVCFVMGYLLQVREIAHRRIHYCCYHHDDIHPRTRPGNKSQLRWLMKTVWNEWMCFGTKRLSICNLLSSRPATYWV